MLRRSRRCRMAACWSTTWHARERFIDSIVARRESVVWRLVDALVAQPVIDNGFVQRTFDVSDMSAQRAIDRLVDAGVLHQTSKGDETAYGKPTKSSMRSITSPNAPVGLGGSGT